MATMEELYIQLSRFLRSYIGLASTQSLRPCICQSDKRLLIHGREKAKSKIWELIHAKPMTVRHIYLCWPDSQCETDSSN